MQHAKYINKFSVYILTSGLVRIEFFDEHPLHTKGEALQTNEPISLIMLAADADALATILETSLRQSTVQ